MAAYITWKDFYSVGNPSLDAQHMQIIGIINELFDAMQNNSSEKTIDSITARLVQYTSDHFNLEEETFRARDYPACEEHKALHDKIRQKTIEWQNHADRVTEHELLSFLKQWWLGHIQSVDKQYAPYLKLASTPTRR
jgi:hemerythrin